jgi:hypothetical protein
MEMILKRTAFNNGYGCSCCADGWESTDWIEKVEMLSPELLLKEIKKNRENMNEGHLIEKIYEQNGDTLYGYTSEIYKAGEDTFVIIGDKKYLYLSSIEGRKPSKKDQIKIEEKLRQHYKECSE